MQKRAAIWLTGIIAAVFGLQTILPSVTNDFVLISAQALSRPWTLITSMFLHAGIVHLLLNGYALAVFGSVLEEIIGTPKFLTVYFIAGIVASIAAVFAYPATLGASGAIMGVMGALAVLRPTMTISLYYIPMPFFIAAIIWVILDLFGFFTGIQGGLVQGSIANASHLAGMAIGVIAGFFLRRGLPRAVTLGAPAIGMTADEFDRWEAENMRKP